MPQDNPSGSKDDELERALQFYLEKFNYIRRLHGLKTSIDFQSMTYYERAAFNSFLLSDEIFLGNGNEYFRYHEDFQRESAGPVQGPVLEVYDYLDEWAGQDFTIEDATRLSTMPTPQLHVLMENWPVAHGYLDREHSLDQIPPGTIRPTVSGWSGTEGMMRTALLLLLYVDEVVVEADVLEPFTLDGYAGPDGEILYSPEEIYQALALLAKIRPLALDGSIKFAGRYRATYPDNLIRYMQALDDVEGWRTDNPMAGFGRHTLSQLMAGNFLLIEEGKATPLSRNYNEELAINTIFSGHILERNNLDKRISQVNLLARFGVPAFIDDPSALVQLRVKGDLFQEWRECLQNALQTINGIPQSSELVVEAQHILSNELESKLKKINSELKRSPALQAIQSGGRMLGFSSIGAAFAGLTGSGLAAGLATSVSSGATQFFYDYYQNRKDRAQKNIIWDVALSFRQLE